MRKFAIILALLIVSAFNRNDNGKSQYGVILTSVDCPVFYDWLQPQQIESTNPDLTMISYAEANLNCQGAHSLNRRTNSIFIPLPVGNYFLMQKDKSPFFKLSYKETNAFSFKVLPDTITYIGEIIVKPMPVSKNDNDNELELQIEVIDMLGESLMLARKMAPDYMDGYPIKKMLWRPVIYNRKINKKTIEPKTNNPRIIDNSPDSFF